MRTCLATLLLLFTAPAFAQKASVTLADALIANRSALHLKNTDLGGQGGTVVREAIRSSSTIAIGEEHGTNEIPRFVSAICDALGPQLSLLALEVGPTAAERLDGPLRAKDREAKMKTFSERDPASAAFLELTADSASAAHCLEHAPHARLAGVDQEFIGAGRMLLDAISRSRLSSKARRAVAVLQAAERAGAEKAKVSGDPSSLLMLSADPSALKSARLAIAEGGDARARMLFGRLEESVMIYRLNSAGDAEANARRARLLKRSMKSARPKTGRVLVKMGSLHLYKGTNPLGQRDLGNWITEDADGARQPASLHIMVVTGKGQRAAFGGYARPLQAETYTTVNDRGSAWLAPALAAQVPGDWTVFDLRQLRVAKITDVSADWRRLIDGYDLLVVIPVATATHGVAG